MIYSTKAALSTETKDVQFIEAGINQNLTLGTSRYGQSPNGNNFIEIKFNKGGASVSHTEYEPTRFGDESEESVQDKVDSQVKRIMQILMVFYPKEVLDYSVSSFEEFAKWTVAMLNAADHSKLLRVKIVYNNSGFAGLPRYWKYTFIESMDIAEKDSKIRELKIDMFTRPDKADVEQKVKTSEEFFSSKPETPVDLSDSPF